MLVLLFRVMGSFRFSFRIRVNVRVGARVLKQVILRSKLLIVANTS